MEIILFNPLSNNGKSHKTLKKLKNKLTKQNKNFTVYSVLEYKIKDISINEEDKFIIIGGDGTLHKILNELNDLNLNNQVYLYKGGSGNDFSRDFKKKLIEITHFIKHHPKVNGNSYLTSAGFGVDGQVCYNVNQDSKSNYFRVAIKTMKTFKRYDLKVNVDGKEYNFSNVWFSSVMNGRCIGGGMKLSPNSNRLDDVLEVVVAHNMGVKRLLLIFPSIFLGKHLIFKKSLFITKGKEITLNASSPQVFQSDGEIYESTDTLNVKF